MKNSSCVIMSCHNEAEILGLLCSHDFLVQPHLNLKWAIWESSKILSNKHLLKWILTLDLEIYKIILFFQYMDNLERIPCSWKLWYLKVSRCLSRFWVGSEPMAEWPYFKSLSCLHFFRFYNFSQLPPRKYLVYPLKFVHFSITLDVNFPFKKKILKK